MADLTVPDGVRPVFIEFEVWRPIPGYPDYEASSLGRIRSLDQEIVSLVNGTTQTYLRRSIKPGRVLSPALDRQGYAHLILYRRGVVVHRLVALAFHGLPPAGKTHAAHRNGKAWNNRPDNIIWATPSENQQHMREHGTYYKRGAAGVANKAGALTSEQARVIRAEYDGKRGSQSALAKKYGVSAGSIRAITRGTTHRDA